jgi:hypothetical protein
MWMTALVVPPGSTAPRCRRSAGRCGRCGRGPSGGVDDGRARAVGEQGGRAAVGLVDEAAQHVGADHEHVVRAAALDLRGASASADRKPVQAAPTSIAPAFRRPRSCATSGAQLG